VFKNETVPVMNEKKKGDEETSCRKIKKQNETNKMELTLRNFARDQSCSRRRKGKVA
jgi:hypothetical protein